MERVSRRVLAVCVAVGACAPHAPPVAPAPPGRTLATFGSDAAFAAFQAEMVRAWGERIRRDPPLGTARGPGSPSPAGYPPPRGEPVDASLPDGVHEPGIVKTSDGRLVVLRAGRVHTVGISDGALRALGSAEAFAAGTPHHRSDADGLLVAGGVAIATARGRDALSVGLLRLDDAGGVDQAGTWQLRTRNAVDRGPPAVRVVDGALVVYAQVGVWAGDTAGVLPYLPAVRRVSGPVRDTAWLPLVTAGRIHLPSGSLWIEDHPTLHAVVVCGTQGGGLECRSSVVYGPRGRAHHVSRSAVYVWTERRPAHGEAGGVRPVVYRIPLDGSAPAALGVEGTPGGGVSFDETEEGELHVLVAGVRAGMPAALLRVPLSAFGDGSRAAGEDAYRALPDPGSGHPVGRFVGGWLLYGGGAEAGAMARPATSGRAFAVRRGGGEPVPLPPPGAPGVPGFEPVPGGALYTAASRDTLRYHPLRLGARAEVGEPFARGARWDGDVAAHAVFAAGPELPGLVGVALSGFGATPSVLFLREEGGRLLEAGELAAEVPPGVGCVPCGPYELARPVFLGGRIFAVLGGEVVEGRMEGGMVREVRRVRFAPTPQPEID